MSVTVIDAVAKIRAEGTDQAVGGLKALMGAFGGLPGVAAIGAGAVVAGTVAIGVAAVKMAGDFQAGMTTLVTGAGESESAIGMVSAGVLQMARDTGTSTKQLTDGLYLIESAGFHGAAGLALLKTAAEGAKVGNADLAVVADALTSAMNAYHLPASSAVSVTNDLIATVKNGKMHMQDLAASLGAILPVASALHVPLDQVTAAMSTMTMQGTDASTATTSLRFLLSALAGPTANAAKEMAALGVGEKDIPGITASTSQALQDLGLHTSAVADMLSKGGLPAALDMITHAIGEKFPVGSAAYEAALKAAVGGTRGMTAALELTGPSAAAYTANLNAISAAAKTGGTSIAGWSTIQGDFNFKIDKAKAVVETLMISIGTKLLPVVGQAVTWFSTNLPGALDKATAALGHVSDAVGWVKQHFDVIGPILAGVGTMLLVLMVPSMIATGVAAVTSFGAWAVSAGAAAIATLAATWPLILVAAAVAAVVAIVLLLVTHWKELSSWFASTDFGKAVIGQFQAITAGVQFLLNKLGDLLGVLGHVKDFAGGVLGGIGNFMDHMPSLPHFAAGGVTPGGLSLVGEQGPELAVFPQGTRILPNQQTAAMLGGGGSGGGTTQSTFIINLDGRTIAESTVRHLPGIVRLATGIRTS